MSAWDEVVGQTRAVEVLLEAAAAAEQVVSSGDAAPGAMTHAWLFTGPPGSGRSVAARAFAAALQCVNGGTGCGECTGCHTVRARTHPDVHFVVPEGLSIAVQEMRSIVLTAGRLPVLGRWQVVLVEDADRLTEAASNALLKAIEEPPSRTVFLLCAPSTHPDDVSITIRSRCRTVALGTPPPEAVAEVLTRRDGIDPGTAAWAAQAAQGHVGRARWLARDQDARERRQAVLDVPASLTSLGACVTAADHLVSAAEQEAAALAARMDGPEVEALKQAMGAGGTGKGATAATRGTAGALKELERRQRSRATRAQRDALDRALVDLAAFYRDVLLLQSGGDVRPAHPDATSDARTVARVLTSEGVLDRLDAVLECREALELNVKPRIAVEAMTVALRLP